MKKRFNILPDTCTTGFQTHATIDLDKPIPEQLHRRTLFFRTGIDNGNILELQKILEWNSSLRVGFGWSFESATVFQRLMAECEMYVKPSFLGDIVEIVSDNRCDWFGFVPFNAFDKEYYKDLGLEDLIHFNNAVIDYQTRVVKFVTTHPMYRAHAMVRNDSYRFEYFKRIRKDPIALSAAFQYYVDSVNMSSGVNTIPRDIIDEMIGCHYLEHPNVFFELLDFNILKGTMYK